MQSKDPSHSDTLPSPSSPRMNVITSTQIITPDTVQAEEVPTIPLGSLQTVSSLQPEVSVHSIASPQSARLPAPLVVQPSEYRRSFGEWLHIWWDGMRPAYLPLSLLPVLLGTTLAWTQTITAKTPRGEFHPTRFIVTLAAVICLQTGAHLVNDYYDYVKGIDTTNSLGPGGLIQQGLIKPSRVLSFGLVLLGLGALLGLLVTIQGGLLIFFFGLLGLLAAYFYSGTARSLSSITLGELVSFLVFGPLLTLGAYIVQTGHADRLVLIYSLAPGLLATAFIHLNNMRDAESDAQAGKRTLASVLDWRVSRVLYAVLLLGAYAPIVALGIPRHAPHLVLITLWTFPLVVVLLTGVFRTDTPAVLHFHMQKTLKLAVLFTLLLIAALIVTAIVAILPHLPSITLPF